MSDFWQAPPDWCYHGFSLPAPGAEIVALRDVVRRSHRLLERARGSGDQRHPAPVLHWAHLLKIEPGTDGAWPAVLNARTGAAVGTQRLRSPLSVLARLAAILQSTEFDAALTRQGGVSWVV